MKKTHRAIVAWVIVVCVTIGILASGQVRAVSAPSLFYNDERWHRDSVAALEVIDGIYYVPVDIFGMFSQVELVLDSRGGEFMVYNRASKRYITVLFEEKIATVNGEEEVYLNLYRLHGGYYYVPAEYFCLVLQLTCEVEKSSSAAYGLTLRLSDGSHTQSLADLLSGYDPIESLETTETTTDSGTTEPPTTTGVDTVFRVNYLTFNTISGDGFSGVLDALRIAGVKATFFVTKEEIHDMPDRIVDAVSGGHVIALTSDHADSAADFLSQMRDANDLLCRIVKIKTHIVQLPGGTTKAGFSEEELTSISEAGYLLWDWTYDVPDSAGYRASYVETLCRRAILASEINVLRMSCNTSVAQLLPNLLRYLSETPNYTVSPIYIGENAVRLPAA